MAVAEGLSLISWPGLSAALCHPVLCPGDGLGMAPSWPGESPEHLGLLSTPGAGTPCAAPSSQLSPWLRLSPSGGLVSVLPSACPASLQTVPVCLALAAGWSRGRVPGPPVHNGSLFTASLPARCSPALAIIPISCALSLLPSCTTEPHPSCSAPVAAALSGRGHPRAMAAPFLSGKRAGCAGAGWSMSNVGALFHPL